MNLYDVTIKKALANQREKSKLDNGEDVFKPTLLRLQSKLLTYLLSSSQIELEILGASKFNNAHKKMVQIFKEVMKELKNTFSYENFTHDIEEIIEETMRAQILKKSSDENSKTLERLIAKLAGHEKSKKQELFKKEEIIANLKDAVQDLALIRDQNIRYVEKRGTAHFNDIKLNNSQELENYKNDIEFLKQTVEKEIRAHEEFLNFINNEIKYLKNQLEIWKNYYNEEMKKIETNIANLRAKIAQKKTRAFELKTTMNLYKKEIEDYLEYKELKRIQAEKDRFIYESATKIQAWWRGTMVRRGLGPYKRKRKQLKDKKNK